jgi:predicted O-methyltransferase YrrM
VLEWDPERHNRLTVGDTEFNVAELYPAPNDARIVIQKSRAMLERMAAVVARTEPRNMVEIGIAKGGSTAFLSQIARPRRLVAIERDTERVTALDDYVAERALGDVVRVHYGVDQADRHRLEQIVESEFGDEPLDFVSDDASHLLAETRASFNVLFPRLRRGGVFMLEDWIWGHHTPEQFRDKAHHPMQGKHWLTLFESGTPLTRFVFELVMACASKNGVVDELTIDADFVVAVRGAAALDPETFDLATSYVEGPVTLLAPEVPGDA